MILRLLISRLTENFFPDTPLCRAETRPMESLNGMWNMVGKHRGGVIAPGNFDGFHQGHQAVVGRALEIDRRQGVSALIGTFDPHPAQYFNPSGPPFELTNMDQIGRASCREIVCQYV